MKTGQLQNAQLNWQIKLENSSMPQDHLDLISSLNLYRMDQSSGEDGTNQHYQKDR
jgi:hypothetical protein